MNARVIPENYPHGEQSVHDIHIIQSNVWKDKMKVSKEYKDLFVLLDNARNKKILVIGDIILDEYEYCYVDGVSTSIKIPIILRKNSKYALGGAANIAANISQYSCFVTLFGGIGDDTNGNVILSLLNDNKVRFIGQKTSQETICKKRLYIDTEQIIRIDSNRYDCAKAYAEQSLYDAMLDADIIVFADYGYNTVTQELIDTSLRFQKRTILTSRHMASWNTTGVSIIISNERELQCKMCCSSNTIQEKHLQHGEIYFITKGSNGILFQCMGKYIESPAFLCKENNSTGAGDSVCAIIASFYDTVESLPLVLTLANIAGAIVVEHAQTYVVDVLTLLERFFSERSQNDTNYKIVDSNFAKLLEKNWKDHGYKILRIKDYTQKSFVEMINNLAKKKRSDKLKILFYLHEESTTKSTMASDEIELIKYMECIDAIIVLSPKKNCQTPRRKTSSPNL